MIQCAVVGAKGYTGCELVKILARHPQVNITHLADKDDEPLDARVLIPNLPPDRELIIKKYDHTAVVKSAEVIFLALPHTKSIEFTQKLKIENKIIIDLSADFRLKNIDTYQTWYKAVHTDPALVAEAVYGLPELYREKIKKARLIANPGCFPTGIMLGLYPLLKKGRINLDSIIVDAKTGVSGAGRNPTAKNHFCEVYENFQAYKINKHQHMPEIEEILSDLAQKQISITFVPHLLPIQRGILSTIYVEKKAQVKADALMKAFCEVYAEEPFIRLLPEGEFPQTKNVENTNYCDIGIWADEASSRLIILTTIDNLVKGASGQAVQNMNLVCGLPEDMGLV